MRVLPTNAGTVLDAEFVGAVLNVLDKYQARAVNWGFYDLTLSEGEIEELLETELPDFYATQWEQFRQVHRYNAATLASELAAANLLYPDPTRQARYRTPFAE